MISTFQWNQHFRKVSVSKNFTHAHEPKEVMSLPRVKSPEKLPILYTVQNFLCHLRVICLQFVCHLYLLRYHPYATCIYLHLLVSHSYVTRMYSHVICMAIICTRMSSVCHSYVLLCHPYVTPMYSYVISMSLECTRMLSFCHLYEVLPETPQ